MTEETTHSHSDSSYHARSSHSSGTHTHSSHGKRSGNDISSWKYKQLAAMKKRKVQEKWLRVILIIITIVMLIAVFVVYKVLR